MVQTSFDEVAPVLDALSDDPLLDAASVRHLAAALAGDVRTYSWRSDAAAAVIGFEYLDEIPLAFNLPRLLGTSSSVVGGRWLVLGTPVRFRHTLYGRGDAIPDLLECVERDAVQQGFDGVVVPWMSHDDERRRIMAEREYLDVFYDADWYLDTTGAASVSELLAGLPRGARRQFRSDANRFATSGATIRGWTGADAELAPRMHLDFMREHGHAAPELRDDSYGRFAQLAAGSIRVAVDETDRPVGYVMVLGDARATHVLRWGRRDGLLPDRLYANLGYLEPLARALALGTARVWFGKSAHRFKKLRGLTPVPASFHVRAFDPGLRRDLRALAAAADVASRRRFDEALVL